MNVRDMGLERKKKLITPNISVFAVVVFLFPFAVCFLHNTESVY